MNKMYNMGGETADDKRYRMQMQKRSGYSNGDTASLEKSKIVSAEFQLQIQTAMDAEDVDALRLVENKSSDELFQNAMGRAEENADKKVIETLEGKMKGGEMDDRDKYSIAGKVFRKGAEIVDALSNKSTEVANKISSLAGANLDDAVTASGRKSKGLLTRKDGTAFAHMGDDVIRIADTRSQYKGKAKMAVAVFGGKAAYDKLTKKEQSTFKSAFSNAHNAGEETFEFKGKEYSTEVKKGKMEGGMMKYAEGSMLMPPEMEMEEEMPEDTYDNIPEDEMAAVEASQLPDSEMEEDYTGYVLGQSLDTEEQDYLMGVLETDERLSGIFDKVMDVAGEFAGEGAVEGPGTGTSDSIPARLSDGEFVFTKKATDQMGADQLQTMMDDAERAYDGGYMKKAFGGLTNNPMEDEKNLSSYDSEAEVKRQMLESNQMPSIRKR